MDMQSLVIFNKHHVKLVELSSFKQIYMTPEKRASSESQNESAEMTFYHTPKFHSRTPGLVPHDCRGENLLGGDIA